MLVLAAAPVRAGGRCTPIVLNGGTSVPSVLGEDAAQAADSLRSEGFTTVTHYVWSDRVDAGAVVRQRPKAGS